MSIIRVSGKRSDYVIINLEQVAWAAVTTNETGGVTRAELHMADGTTLPVQDTEAEWVITGLRETHGEVPTDPSVQG